MNLFCVICCNSFPEETESLVEEYKDVCSKCRKILVEEAPDVPLYGTDGGGSIEDMVEELEFRIPDLFSGPECPLDFSKEEYCDCTYETGCRALKDLEETGSYKKIYFNRKK
jgi:hypothetical protein